MLNIERFGCDAIEVAKSKLPLAHSIAGRTVQWDIRCDYKRRCAKDSRALSKGKALWNRLGSGAPFFYIARKGGKRDESRALPYGRTCRCLSKRG